MIFAHPAMVTKPGIFSFSGSVTVSCHPVLHNQTIRDIWHGYTFHLSDIQFEPSNTSTLQIGHTDMPELQGAAYALRVTTAGISIIASNQHDLIRGFMTLLDLIQLSPEGNGLEIPCCELKEKPFIQNRMIHYCVFHSCELWQLERFIKMCGVLKYTHIILEFWGMYKYDCLKELSWSNGFTKEELRPILRMARDLGIEIVPMVNHWGHASASRDAIGKHVVLNQNLKLGYLFSEDGWCWNIRDPRVKALLKEMRHELCDLCGEGSYFHIGCDEAYGFDFSKESMDAICAYINETAEDIRQTGRRTMIWCDMILSKRADYTGNGYLTLCPSQECEEYMQNALDKNLIACDWQYWVKEKPVETAISLKNAGFDTMLCPWDDPSVINACCQTVLDHLLFGLIHTTWHTLTTGVKQVVGTAQACWNELGCATDPAGVLGRKAATILRKIYESPEYRKAGWAYEEVNQ